MFTSLSEALSLSKVSCDWSRAGWGGGQSRSDDEESELEVDELLAKQEVTIKSLRNTIEDKKREM